MASPLQYEPQFGSGPEPLPLIERKSYQLSGSCKLPTNNLLQLTNFVPIMRSESSRVSGRPFEIISAYRTSALRLAEFRRKHDNSGALRHRWNCQRSTVVPHRKSLPISPVARPERRIKLRIARSELEGNGIRETVSRRPRSTLPLSG